MRRRAACGGVGGWGASQVHAHARTGLVAHAACPPSRPPHQEVETSEARAYADEIGALFMETSAKANRNVQELFVDISRRLPAPAEAAFNDLADLTTTSTAGEGKKGKGKGCC